MASSGNGKGWKERAKSLKDKVLHSSKSRSAPSAPPPPVNPTTMASTYPPQPIVVPTFSQLSTFSSSPSQIAVRPTTRVVSTAISGGLQQTAAAADSSTRVGTSIQIVSQILKVATAATAVFPLAQSVIGGVSDVVDLARASNENESQRKAMRKVLEESIRRLQLCQSHHSPSQEMIDRIKRLTIEIEIDITGLDNAMNESWWKKLTEGDAQVMAEMYGKLSSKLNTFTMETVIDINGNIGLLAEVTEQMSRITSQIQVDVKFKELGYVEQARFDAGPVDLRGPCTPETRTQILDDLMTWVSDDTRPPCYWLCGMAGTGKTTIPFSFCERLRDAGLLCADYFCSRTVEGTRDPRAIIPTLALSLAHCSQASSDALLSVLQNRDNHGIRYKNLVRQFNALILEPAKALAASTLSKRLVVVCDGLDEADSLKEIGEIITLFLETASRLPVKFFISSRLDHKIKNRFQRGFAAIRGGILPGRTSKK